MAEGDFTGYEFQTPIFVLVHDVPAAVAKGENDNLRFTFVTDGVASATARAKAAAGDMNVMVIGGAQTIRQLLKAGLVDELEIGLVPVLLGDDLRLFERLDAGPLELEQIEIIESPGRTDLGFRVLAPAKT